MERIKRGWRKTPKRVRQPLVLVVGSCVLLAGIVMLAIPGPGWATIFAGLAILSTEFEKPNRLKNWLIGKFKAAAETASNRFKKH